ncbi:C-type lectin lectoxin-Thr1-like [Mercenaria mercenaria]|uniref:C-type lectin lectoxin-Thr1-like n=1 Tax=Mercenaria mercenaria TaxID=6596 RepID=UPI00234EB835|nr:C-type lectin lectoxin-Thr1-like [Mercenaria mercenaria]
MEKEMLCRFWILFITPLLYHQCDTATDVKYTAAEEIDGEYLLKMGKKFNKPTLTLIGMAIRNLQPCGEWTTWTACTASRLNHFGIRRRTRECGVNMKINGESKSKTEKDFSICEGFCRADYVLSTNGFCIKIYTLTKNQVDADKQCQADGGNLVHIDTDMKYGDVKNLTGLPSTYIYIGGRRKDTNSPWVFAKGSQNGFYRWASGQPDNGSDQLCLILKGSDKLMHDASGSPSRHFLCELNM